MWQVRAGAAGCVSSLSCSQSWQRMACVWPSCGAWVMKNQLQSAFNCATMCAPSGQHYATWPLPSWSLSITMFTLAALWWESLVLPIPLQYRWTILKDRTLQFKSKTVTKQSLHIKIFVQMVNHNCDTLNYLRLNMNFASHFLCLSAILSLFAFTDQTRHFQIFSHCIYVTLTSLLNFFLLLF